MVNEHDVDKTTSVVIQCRKVSSHLTAFSSGYRSTRTAKRPIIYIYIH